jgi:hypothetical protein
MTGYDARRFGRACHRAALRLSAVVRLIIARRERAPATFTSYNTVRNTVKGISA